MVITVRGTSENHNKAAHATAVMAAIGAVRKSRKSLVLQLCSGVPIEDMLVGKKRKETEIVEDTFVFEDTGVDSVFLRLKTQRMQKEQFDICCVHTMSMENMLDVAAQTLRKELFEAELVQDEQSIEDLLLQAHEIYDDVYIYANGKNPKLCEILNRHSDLVVTCVRQGNKEKLEEVPENALYLITSYDPDSIFSKRFIKNLYKANHIAVMPYNVEFKDSYNNGTLINFILKNQKINEDDITYPFVSAMNTISDTYLENKREEYVDPDPMELLDKINKEKKELRDYEEPDVEVVEKKGMFGKTKKKIVAGENGRTMDDEFASINKKKLLGIDHENKENEQQPDDLEDYEEIEDIPDMDEDFDEIEEHIEDDEVIEEALDDITKKSRKDKKAKKEKKKKEKKGWFGRKDKKEEPDDKLEELEEATPVDEDEEIFEDEELIDFNDDDYEEVEELSVNTQEADEPANTPEPVNTQVAEETAPPAKKKRGRPRKTDKPAEPVKTQEMTEEVPKMPEITQEAAKDGTPKGNTNEWICPSCGAVNSKKFCLECGSPKPAPVVEKDWFCPECGEKNPAKAKFCLECGEKKPEKE